MDFPGRICGNVGTRDRKNVDNLDGKPDSYGVRGMMVITTGEAKLLQQKKDAELTMIPYYADANRGATGMEVYIRSTL